ncbi:response regulator transcription factor [Desulfofundulus sp. TPOSR]|uniref:response regulator transcription factor n=1 Tax=Desulfofundulus sp. TPOSR TaxID=2714340 RepID=UPI00140E46E3|nr:response regulator transcription factor [Desulfofundulus sp. TPOSR]NHM28687.1 response regulator transcription factor [Desulfofundulus sp. TPOSR]
MDKRILIVEDEEGTRKYVRFVLEQNGFTVYEAASGEEALELVPGIQPHLMLLDVKLPGMDGYEVCHKIRNNHPGAGIIMLTACDEGINKVKGLELGADDYIVKPFDSLELAARVKAVFRRLSHTPGDIPVSYSDLKIIPSTRQVYRKGAPVALTPREYDLLLFLARNPNRIISREELLNHVWGDNYLGELKTVDIYISRLRAKLEDRPDKPRLIKTMRGVGYLFKPD